MKKIIINLLEGCGIGLVIAGGIQTGYVMFFEKEPEVVVETVYIEKENVEIEQDEVPLAHEAEEEKLSIDEVALRTMDGMIQYFDGKEWVDLETIEVLQKAEEEEKARIEAEEKARKDKEEAEKKAKEEADKKAKQDSAKKNSAKVTSPVSLSENKESVASEENSSSSENEVVSNGGSSSGNEQTPSYTPDPTPSYTPDPTPSYTPDPTPSYTPDPTPSYTPDPTPSYTPEPTPDPTPEPEPEPEPAPSTDGDGTIGWGDDWGSDLLD